mgnify:FL=1
MKNKRRLTEFLKYVSLNIAGMIGLSCYILADTFFVSKGLGTSGLAALNLAIPIYNFIHGTGLMLGIGAATKYSIYRGKGDNAAADKTFTNILYTAALFSAVFVAAGLIFSKNITAMLGADTEVFAMTNTYLKVILLFAPAFMMNDILICFVRNDGNPQLSMAAMLTGSLSNIILDYIFIFPCQMGIFGAVFATGLAPVISIMVLSLHFLRHNNKFGFKKTPVNIKETLSSLSLGFPSLITEFSSGIVIIVFNAIILKIMGNTGVAAYGIIANISLVAIAIYTGIAQGVQPLISREYGNNNMSNAKYLLNYALCAVVILSAAIYSAVFFGADPIASIFNSEGNALLQSTAVCGMKLYFIGCVFAGFNIIVSAFFTSTETPVPAHVISCMRGWLVIIPLAFAMSAMLGITGVWLAFPSTELICTAVGAVILIKIYKKTQSH